MSAIKVYCEHGALTAELRALQARDRIVLIHFPYDRDGRSKHIKRHAMPSAAQWRDMNIVWNEANFRWNDIVGSEHLNQIRHILGQHNRRDALHIDSAYKSGCACFITRDKGILRKRRELETLLGIPFFEPDEDHDSLISFLE